MTPRVCPCCGYDLIANAPVSLNGFTMLSPNSLTFNGKVVNLTNAQREIVWSLMKAYPERVTNGALIERIGSSGSPDMIKVHIHHIRKHLKGLGGGEPIRSAYGGYQWVLA